MTPTIQGELVKEYLRKYSAYGSMRIARILYETFPVEFGSVERARRFVRYYRGSIGSKDRAKLTEETFIPRVEIPASDEAVYEPFVLGKEAFPILIGSDAHVPYHDQDVLEMLIDRGIEIGARTVILNGDWADFHLLSHFVRDPRKRDPLGELEVLVGILEIIHRELPHAHLIYKFGNHEERFDTYLMQAAPEMFKLPEMHLSAVLMKRCPWLEIVEMKRVIYAEGLNIIHGHEYKNAIMTPVNPARGLFIRAKKSSLCGHFHQTSEHSEPTIEDKLITTWSTGCMCERHPQYMPLNNWNHGFAEVHLDEEGLYHVLNRRIVNYKML